MSYSITLMRKFRKGCRAKAFMRKTSMFSFNMRKSFSYSTWNLIPSIVSLRFFNSVPAFEMLQCFTEIMQLLARKIHL
jgi:hypothetical protein